MPQNPSAPSRATLTVFRLAAVVTFLAVAMGAVVCATGSGASCPTWPGCRPDQIAPQWALSPLIEFIHRVIAVSAGPLVLAAAVMSRRLPGCNRWVRILPLVALAGALASGAFGRMAILSSLPTYLGGVDLFSALTAMTATGVAAVLVGAAAHSSSARSAAAPRPVRVFRLAAMSLAAIVTMHVSGIFAAGKGSYTRCLGWPIWQRIDSDLHPWLQDLRLGLAVLGAVLVVSTVVVAVRNARLRRWGVALGTLFAVEMVLGQVIRAAELNKVVATGYSVTAVALVSCLGLLMAVTWPAPVATETVPGQPARSLPEPAAPVRH